MQDRRGREGSRRRIGRVAPYRVGLACADRIAHAAHAVRELEDRPEPACVEAHRRPGGDEVVVDERLDSHVLLDPVALVGGTFWHESWELEPARLVIHLTEPEEILDPVVVREEVEGRTP